MRMRKMAVAGLVVLPLLLTACGGDDGGGDSGSDGSESPSAEPAARSA